MAREKLETWYKGDESIQIDINHLVQVRCFTKKGYGPKKVAIKSKITKTVSKKEVGDVRR